MITCSLNAALCLKHKPPASYKVYVVDCAALSHHIRQSSVNPTCPLPLAVDKRCPGHLLNQKPDCVQFAKL